MVRTIQRDELKEMMDSGESFVLVNVLDREDFENRHICGSINIPASSIAKEAVNALKKEDCVVVYCSGPACTASLEAAEELDSQGYSNVWRFQGGIAEWKDAGYCMEGLSYREKVAV